LGERAVSNQPYIKNVLRYLESSVRTHPDKTAFADESASLTFASLHYMALSIGTRVASTVRGVNRPVAVLVDRSANAVAAFLGALYSGNFYVPIDRTMPIKRILTVIDKLSPAALLYAEADIELAKQILPRCQILCLEDALDETPDMPLIDSRRGQILDTDPVYVLFTSGSTGEPKGIVVSHRSVIDFTEWMAATCDCRESDVLGNQAPFYFDVSVKDIYLTLKCACTTYIIPRKALMFPPLLIRYLNDNAITAINWAVSAFVLVAASGILITNKPKTLTRIVTGGEALYAKHLNVWKKALPDATYIHMYGPTEITVDCAYYVVDREFEDGERLPIGRACENMEILLLGDDGEPVPPESPGEICVRGAGLALGYYGDFTRTSESFVQNPQQNHYPELIYKTGDMGFVDGDGLLRFLSRRDSQIKHMGARIELGEVEGAINAIDNVSDAICFFDEPRDKIVCVVTGHVSGEAIIAGLRESLPKSMFPNVIQKRGFMPLNANGKNDRALIKEEYFNAKYIDI
jgi:amino acid adenylation domain-containing protein